VENIWPVKTSSFFGDLWYYVTWSWGEGSNSLYINGILEDSMPEYRAVSGKADEEVGRSPYDASNVADGVPGYFYGTLDDSVWKTEPEMQIGSS
jgi:hypothetical protein